METKKRNEIIVDAYNKADEIKKALYDIVWESQCNQQEHFDDLPKVEKVALIDLLSNATNLMHALSTYKSWFIDK